MNIITIDSSKNSSAIAVESSRGIRLFNYTNQNLNNIWHKEIKDYVQFYHIDYPKMDNYSHQQFEKLKILSQISSRMVTDLIAWLDPEDEVIVAMEGYNYGHSAGQIVDLVEMGQSIRLKIWENLTLRDFRIVSPTELKSKTCELAYGIPPPKLGKKGQPLKEKVSAISPYGVVGGAFEKQDMLKAVLDGQWANPILDYIQAKKVDLLALSKIPKPFDDLVDAICLLYLVKNQKI